ncbi:Uncharacterized membrane protein YeiH [Desulfocicer vacuolatum DSM 3385]|uniref:Uncharacterized membrane protein YeiH n=1 Tax=Desulfocicer vacuolatum DSM 3385 TaxID=1121400 RepID=A0A1W2D2L4_9BACT|nr:trimeric intracellular cation channel family protein [Desulfocicer vacuolatum]SMC91693.1 Uncharacterized membrane protein YeiH [Desulfocicer vacuolatum DSM 3385]
MYILAMIGLSAFAVSGVMAAGKKDMDIFSIVLLGTVTALGGGTLRDMVIDVNPVFWIEDLSYLWISLIASAVTFFMIRLMDYLFKLLLYFDAFGLALFTVLATEKTILLGFSRPVAVLMGLSTGIVGGMIRDVLTGRKTLLLSKEFYATPALLGGIVFAFLNYFFPDHEFNRIYAICLIFFLRAAAIQWGLYFPKWLMLK